MPVLVDFPRLCRLPTVENVRVMVGVTDDPWRIITRISGQAVHARHNNGDRAGATTGIFNEKGVR